MSENPYFILTIDGGGIRGAFPAYVLNCIEERLKINIYERFDLIAGTSTGSIIAGGLACNKKPREILKIYKEESTEIFGSKICSIWPPDYKQGFHSKYNKSKLEKVLKREFENQRLGDLKKPLLIPATDIGNGCVHVFKSRYSDKFTRDEDVLIHKAIMASCSAPTYFDPSKIDQYLLADGGLWANNPTLAAIIEAKNKLGVALSRIRVLSLGTGHSRKVYGTDPDKKWGLLNGWGSTEFINFILSIQAQATNNYTKLMLDTTQLLRIDFETDLPLSMDDNNSLDNLLSRADKEFTYKSKDIAEFLT